MPEDNNREEVSPEASAVERPSLYRNVVSWAGTVIFIIALANVIFLFILESASAHSKPYLGIFAYMVFPAIMVFGALLVPFGMLLERRRRRRHIPELPAYPRLDLNNPRTRKVMTFFASFATIFILLSAVGSYKAYEVTDSVGFCGQLCHNVMNPEFTAYQLSPHARVRCVDCHVGPGAGWYVRSKMSGLRQVWHAAKGDFPRPIPSPVANLRPAQETCEQCHWPEKFWGAQLKEFNHFASDEKNTPRHITMLIKTGGGSPGSGQAAGIHWHMNIANEVWYAASDRQHQVIPWVKVKDRNGNVTEYQLKDANPADIKKLAVRRMDCVDCHNRPTHIYIAPDAAVDRAMTAGSIDPTLPFIKQQGVTALTAEYKTNAQALPAIATAIENFYSSKYPQVVAQRPEAVKAAVRELQRIYSTSIFPEMNLDWRTHPNNIGHFYSAGCFRCHDGNHVSADGKTIRRDCEICHTVLNQQQAGSEVALVKGAFQHPGGDLDLATVSCSDCHTGGSGP
jgi:nitrate/TMAO reductase-like tetraheme cytochrome c subunit